MRFILTIQCDNAAFGDTPAECQTEVARILERLLPGLCYGALAVREDLLLKDHNGNTVGSARFEDEQSLGDAIADIGRGLR